MLEGELIDTSEQEDTDCSVSLRFMIGCYGADFSVDSLVERLKTGEINLPGFHRRYVWSQAQASRFIESLLLGLPVPGIFLFREPASERLIVADGHQRLQSLLGFYDNKFREREFSLRGVSKPLAGLKYADLGATNRSSLDNSLLHGTIFHQFDHRIDNSSVFEVFQRLNATGTPLFSQEIRECIYQGSLNDLLGELNQESAWRKIYGPASDRARDKELILRFFALKHHADRYSRPLKHFLNRYLDENSQASSEWIEQRRVEFKNVTAIASAWLPRKAFRRGSMKLNAAITDAILVGLSDRLDRGPIIRKSSLSAIAMKLRNDDRFVDFTDRSTTDASSVQGRIDQAKKAFDVD